MLFVCARVTPLAEFPFKSNVSFRAQSHRMVPVTLLPQLTPRMHFGPDTSLGILPGLIFLCTTPNFFGFIRYSSRVQKLTGLVVWPWHLLGACLCFPARPRHCVSSSADTFCMVDVFWIHWNVPKMVLESRVMRYVSDSQNWLYLNIPLVSHSHLSWKLPSF